MSKLANEVEIGYEAAMVILKNNPSINAMLEHINELLQISSTDLNNCCGALSFCKTPSSNILGSLLKFTCVYVKKMESTKAKEELKYTTKQDLVKTSNVTRRSAKPIIYSASVRSNPNNPTTSKLLPSDYNNANQFSGNESSTSTGSSIRSNKLGNRKESKTKPKSIPSISSKEYNITKKAPTTIENNNNDLDVYSSDDGI